MANLLSKFKVSSVTDFGNNNKRTLLAAVTSDSPENKTFSLYTPSANIEILVNNPNAINFFEAGKEYYVEFKPAN